MEKPVTQLIPSSEGQTVTPASEHVVILSRSSQDFEWLMSKKRGLALLGDPTVRQLKGSPFQKVEVKHFVNTSGNPDLTVSPRWKNPIGVFTCSWQCSVVLPGRSTP